MNIEVKKSDSSISNASATTIDSIITLIPCEFDPKDGYDSLSGDEESIDSSEIVDSSDDELEVIKINEIHKTTEQLI